MENAKLKSSEETSTFEDYGLAVGRGPALVGNVYPIFGMITDIKDLGDGDIEVEINRNIYAKMFVKDPEKLEVLRRKAFETGIFVSKVESVEPRIEVECQAVIFGRDQGHNA